MKTEQKTEIMTYWTCHNTNHKHKTEETAMNCIKKHERAEAFAKKKEDKRLLRQKKDLIESSMIEEFKSGVELSEIAKRVGMTDKKAKQTIEKALRMNEHLRIWKKMESRDFEIGDVVNVVSYPFSMVFEITQVDDQTITCIMNEETFVISKWDVYGIRPRLDVYGHVTPTA